ncbi:MAG: PAS domain-containing protein [Polyangiaceae bacterium]|nr:PAS domain-containing protein [Polyangiaceae bacterium]
MSSSGASDQHLVVLNAALRVAARHPSLLAPVAFKELFDALSSHLPIAGLVALIPDGEGYQRIYVDMSDKLSPSPIGSGSRIPQMAVIDESIYIEGRPFVCNDTRVGNEVHRIAAASGFLSYVLVPIKSADGKRTVGELAYLFREVGEALRAPLELLVAVCEVVGLSFERAVRFARDRRLAMILDTSSDAMLAWDDQGRVTDANAAASALTGFPREELLGRDIGTLLEPRPDRVKGLPAPDARIVLLARGVDGEEYRLPAAATITAVEDDPLVACHALIRDLTAWEMREREVVLHLARIHELEEQHRTLLDNAPLIIFRLDPRTHELVYLNHCAERLLGVPLDEALATTGFLRALHDAEGALAYDEALSQACAGLCSLPYEARLSRREGVPITARGTIYPLLGKAGNVVAIEGLFMDVSAEHAARTRLIQADRLSTLGTLAAGVAHEINNPAAFILLGIDMLGRMLDGSDAALGADISKDVHDLLTELRDSTRRIVDIVRDLRMFARAPGGTRRIAVDVNRTVESALTLTRGQIVERAEVVRDLADVPNVLIDEGRLGQVLVNLLVNAAQAIPRASRGEAKVFVSTRSHDGRVVEIEIRDTGVGIPPDIQQRIWDPFFTTKDPGAGTGLGLSISREIIERSGGRLYVESPVPGTDPPGGSRFIVELPASSSLLSPLPPMPTWPPRSIGGPARVLVIEDEVLLARALAAEIGRVHVVQVAANAKEALDILASKLFDVILCDVRMPGLSGAALFEMVKQNKPHVAIRFVFMTGVGFGADFERFLSESGRPILEKPFSVEDALSIIRKVVSKHGRAQVEGTS